MPLSEYEQRVLEQMERALTSDDPRLATTLQSTPRKSGVRYVAAGIGVVGGLLLLIFGAASSLPVLGVVGFVVMFVGVAFAFSTPRSSTSGPVGVVDEHGKVTPPKAAKRGAPREGFIHRLEARWDRRREQGGR
jgi:hypothetical protein